MQLWIYVIYIYIYIYSIYILYYQSCVHEAGSRAHIDKYTICVWYWYDNPPAKRFFSGGVHVMVGKSQSQSLRAWSALQGSHWSPAMEFRMKRVRPVANPTSIPASAPGQLLSWLLSHCGPWQTSMYHDSQVVVTNGYVWKWGIPPIIAI